MNEQGSNDSFPDDLTPAEIVAKSLPAKPGRRRRTGPARNLGVYDSDRDILDQYLFEVSKTPLLTPPEEMAVARLVRAGDPDAMQELVKRNLRFVISVAKKYQNRGMGLSDLIGEGNLGLLTAARKFDPDQGVKFISYAVWWIRQSILAALARHGRTVRVPLNRTADLSRITRTSETLRQELRREPTPEELAVNLGLSVDVVRSLAALNTADVRLDAPLDPEGERSLLDRFIADEQGDPEEQAMERFLAEQIDLALRTLPARDAKVLRLYFGLDGGREHTLEEIGGMLGVTRERIRQLRDRALKRLREGQVGRALASFAARAAGKRESGEAGKEQRTASVRARPRASPPPRFPASPLNFRTCHPSRHPVLPPGKGSFLMWAAEASRPGAPSPISGSGSPS